MIKTIKYHVRQDGSFYIEEKYRFERGKKSPLDISKVVSDVTLEISLASCHPIHSFGAKYPKDLVKVYTDLGKKPKLSIDPTFTLTHEGYCPRQCNIAMQLIQRGFDCQNPIRDSFEALFPEDSQLSLRDVEKALDLCHFIYPEKFSCKDKILSVIKKNFFDHAEKKDAQATSALSSEQQEINRIVAELQADDPGSDSMSSLPPFDYPTQVESTHQKGGQAQDDLFSKQQEINRIVAELQADDPGSDSMSSAPPFDYPTQVETNQRLGVGGNMMQSSGLSSYQQTLRMFADPNGGNPKKSRQEKDTSEQDQDTMSASKSS